MPVGDQSFPRLDSQAVDPRTGRLTQPWHRFLISLWVRSGGGTGYDIATLQSDVYGAAINEIAGDPLDIAAIQDAGLFGAMFTDERRDADDPSISSLLFNDDIEERAVAAVRSVTVGASPAAFSAVAEGNMLISGGTISAVSLTRRGAATTLPVSVTLVPLSAGDALAVTYTVAPTLTFIPR